MLLLLSAFIYISKIVLHFFNVLYPKLLLGARCDSNTFDGERCLYSALTLEIKKMLKDYKAISKDCIRRDNYVEFFKRYFLPNLVRIFKGLK